MGNLLMNHYVALLAAATAATMSFLVWRRTESGQVLIDRFKLNAPIFGKITTMVAICRFCRILGTMLHNSVPNLHALRISSDYAGSSILAGVINEAADSVKKGAPLSDPLRDCGMFPPTVVDMIAVAEEGNNLETVLVQIADTNEARTARSIDLAVRILEPILLVIMAMAVFCIAVGLLLPILTMGTSVQ